MEQNIKFEEAIEKLGTIVKKLENGEVSLEDAIKLYEEGIELSKYCADLLQKAEQKVRFLQEQAENQNDE